MSLRIYSKKCFKNIVNLSCIDFFLTNNTLTFQLTKTVSTGLSEIHKLVLTVLKTDLYRPFQERCAIAHTHMPTHTLKDQEE